MSTNRNIVEMVEAIRNGISAEGSAGGIDRTYVAEVISVEPLTIKMNNVQIKKNIYINPALLVEASDGGERMKKVFQESFDTPEAYGFLKEFHEKCVLKPGDTVVVHLVGSGFYISGKAVKA